MESLPDEILQRLFSFFCILERQSLESVCQRWRALMLYRFKEIDLVNSFLSGSRLKTADTFPLTPSLRTFLKRSSMFLKSISFGKSNLLIPFTLINKINECCPALEELDLSFCTVTEQIVPALMGMADRLRSLNLGNTVFTIWQTNQHVDNLSILFANFKRLENINLQRTNACNLLAVSHLPDSLTRLNLNACSPLSPSTLFELVVKCYDLEDIRLSAYSRVNSHIVEAICTLPRLRILDISRQSAEFLASSTGGCDWKKLQQVTTLQEFYAQYNDNITDYVLESISQQNPNLRILNLSYCRRICTFLTWLWHLRNLSAFFVAANDRFTDEAVCILAEQNASTLRIFHAPCCPSLSGCALRALAIFCHDLVEVNVGQCESMDDEDAKELFVCCRKLEIVDLRASQITDGLFKGLLELNDAPQILTQLRKLDISFCRGVTDVGMQDLCRFLAMGSNRKEQVIVYVHQTRIIPTTVRCDRTCADQHVEMFQCIMDLKQGAEVKSVLEKEKAVKATCMPDYPKSCIEETAAIEDCLNEVSTVLEKSNEAGIAAIANMTSVEMNKCFEHQPLDPLAGLDILFMPPVMPMRTNRAKRYSAMEKSSSEQHSGNSSEEQTKGMSSEQNNSSEEFPKTGKHVQSSSSASKEKQLSNSSEESGEMKIVLSPKSQFHWTQECVKTPQQVACMTEALMKATEETSFADTIDKLMEKKEECEKKFVYLCYSHSSSQLPQMRQELLNVQQCNTQNARAKCWSSLAGAQAKWVQITVGGVTRLCQLSTPELASCYWQAHQALIEWFSAKMDTCMQGKAVKGSAVPRTRTATLKIEQASMMEGGGAKETSEMTLARALFDGTFVMHLVDAASRNLTEAGNSTEIDLTSTLIASDNENPQSAKGHEIKSV